MLYILRKIQVYKGPSFSRNLGIEFAPTRWVLFLDSDDYYHPLKLEFFSKYIASMNLLAPAIIADNYLIADNSYFKFPHFIFLHCRVSLFSMLCSNQISTPCVAFNKDLPFRFNPLRRFSEDYELWLKIILAGYDVYKIPFHLTFISKHAFLSSNGLSSNLISMSLEELKVLLSLWQKLNVIILPFAILSTAKSVLRIVRYSLWSFRQKVLFHL